MTKTSKKWSSERIIKFLEAYEQYPCLWNHKLPSYKDKSKRDEALRKIVEVMSDPELNVNSAKAKIRSIRNAYTLEHHKVLKSYKNGISGDIYKPTVCWFSVADRFLKGIVETRDTKNASELPELRGLQGHIEEGHENEGNETSFQNHYHFEVEETAADNHTVHSLASSTSNQSIKDPQKIIAKRKFMNNKQDHPYKQEQNKKEVARTLKLQEVNCKIWKTRQLIKV
ncbi:uncharacterized protein LOC128886948 isoform X2 [Hylaeus anthracinus]|uniref:uncharacterized protein LOC128886948 isoform X2 n=1 Tax=Hylaeus anthracinus TaxID=313031 RepID=UPI0023BA02D2|nr:uncharacterized protein LOC128886948 isoform X2 [Hylaeus anthracinus]